jgi:hypothetical protein
MKKLTLGISALLATSVAFAQIYGIPELGGKGGLNAVQMLIVFGIGLLVVALILKKQQ